MFPEDVLFIILQTIVVFLAFLCGLKLADLFILRNLLLLKGRFRHTFFYSLIRALKARWFFLSVLLATYFSLSGLQARREISLVFFIIFIVYLAWLLHRSITYQMDSLIADRKERRRSITSLKLFSKIADILIWIGAILVIVWKLEYDLTVILAGLGVGGILFAVASQKILLELFSSFALYSDHVFEGGDFIVIGDFKGGPGLTQGRIERIGLRSTCLRAPNGESILVPNQELAGKIIYNYSKKKGTKMSLIFGVSYETEADKLKQLDRIVGDILEQKEMVARGQLTFQQFGANGMIFEILYDLETSDYDQMRRIHQDISLRLKEQLDWADIKVVGSQCLV